MAENRVEANAHNAGGCPASNAIHGHINDFLVRTGLRSGVSELQLPCFTAVRAEIALMSGGAFAVTHHPVSSLNWDTGIRSHPENFLRCLLREGIFFFDAYVFL